MDATPYYGFNAPPPKRRIATLEESFKKHQIRRYGAIKPRFTDILHLIQNMPKRDVTQVLRQVAGLVTPAESNRLRRVLSLQWARQPMAMAEASQRNMPVVRRAVRQPSSDMIIEGTQDTFDEEPELLSPPVPRRRGRPRKNR